MSLISKLKPIHLLIALVFLIIPIIAILLSFIKSGKTIDRKNIMPTPVVRPVTSPSPLPPGVKTMQIIRAAPFSREDIFYLPIQPVELTFTDDVSPTDLKYTINPKVETLVEQGSIPTSIIISPVKSWVDGTTKITILSSTVSRNKTILNVPFIYELRTSLPPAPPPESEDNY